MSTKKAVLAEYFLLQDRACVFVAQAGEDMQVFEVPLRREDLRAEVRQRFGGARTPPDAFAGDWDALLAPLVAPLANMSDSGDLLWLVPHDVLHVVPMHAVRFGSMTLAQRNPVVYSPSASTMRVCQKRSYPLAHQAVVVADPSGDLPYARLEQQTIQSLYSVHDPLVGAAASKKALLSQLQGDKSYSVVHFACHAFFDSEDATQSALVLAGPNGNARLTAEELLGITLRADLVTLSSCESGLVERRSGDELIGLSRALLFAGARSILVSLWPVNDFSTSLLMEGFYSTLGNRVNATWGKATALAEGQRRVRELTVRRLLELLDTQADAAETDSAGELERTGDRLRTSLAKKENGMNLDTCPFASPFYWAPFALIGDWQ